MQVSREEMWTWCRVALACLAHFLEAVGCKSIGDIGQYH